MKKFARAVAMLAIVVILGGCCALSASDEDLMREVRQSMVESIRPALVDALDKAKGPDGESLYVDAYRDEKVNLADEVILSIDRVYPPVAEDGSPAPYVPEPLPWGNVEVTVEEPAVPDGGDE